MTVVEIDCEALAKEAQEAAEDRADDEFYANPDFVLARSPYYPRVAYGGRLIPLDQEHNARISKRLVRVVAMAGKSLRANGFAWEWDESPSFSVTADEVAVSCSFKPATRP